MSGHEYDPEEEGRFRETAPMQAFTMGEVTIGAVAAAVGLLVTFAVPLLLT